MKKNTQDTEYRCKHVVDMGAVQVAICTIREVTDGEGKGLLPRCAHYIHQINGATKAFSSNNSVKVAYVERASRPTELEPYPEADPDRPPVSTVEVWLPILVSEVGSVFHFSAKAFIAEEVMG